jgi:hypothetical protein
MSGHNPSSFQEEHFARLAAASNMAQRAAATLAAPAPTAPGLRGMVGAVLLRLVDRLLWWRLQALREFGAASEGRDRAQLGAVAGMEAQLKKLTAQNRQLEIAQLDLQSVQLSYVSSEEIAKLQDDLADLKAQLRMISRQVNAVQARTGVADKTLGDIRRQLKTEALDGEPRTRSSCAIDPELTRKIRIAVTALERFRVGDPQAETAAQPAAQPRIEEVPGRRKAPASL